MPLCEPVDVNGHLERERLRRLATERLGFVESAMQDVRLDRALAHLTKVEGSSAAAALEALPALPAESVAWQQIIDALVVGETRFMRQASWFVQIERHILKPLVEKELRSGRKRLRIWSAACATGEEPYTLAMLLFRLLPSTEGWTISIVATDVNERYLAEARRGIYHERSFRELDPALRDQHFVRVDADHYEISPQMKDFVTFQTLNLTDKTYPDDTRFLDLDLIVCRNVLIYLTQSHQRAVAERLTSRLGRCGWLAVAPAEAVAEWYRPLAPINVPSAIFFHAVEAGAPVPLHAPAPRPISTPLPKRPAIPAAAVPPTIRVADVARAGPAADERIVRIRELADRGDLATARRRCEEWLANEELRDDAYLLLAIICEEMRDDDAALEAAKRAIYIRPTSAAAHFICGTVLARLGRRRAAHRKMNDVLQLLDGGETASSSVWDVTAERLRSAAVGYLAGTGA